MYSRTGEAVQVSPESGDVVLSENVRGATTFQLVGCRARDSVPDALRDLRCLGRSLRCLGRPFQTLCGHAVCH